MLPYCLLTAFFAFHAGAADIASDERVHVYPALGRLSPDGLEWIINVQVLVYEEGRGLVVSALERTLRGRLSKGEYDSKVFKDRMRPFFHDSERREVVMLRIADREFTLRPTGNNGRAIDEIRIPVSAVPMIASAPASIPPTLTARVVLSANDTREFTGDVRLLPPTGLSIISDIDDTIRLTFVNDPHRMFRTTFCEPFRAVSGMPELFAHWANEHDAVFHYVSGSPWQLYEPLSTFLVQSPFPPGSFHLREFNWDRAIAFDPFIPCEQHKVECISALLVNYPLRRFVLVGDSGQSDPEAYGRVARRFPAQVTAIFIRDVTGESPASPRYIKAFDGIEPGKWRTFTNAADLRNSLPK